MRIFAFSDWRSQEFEPLLRTINSHEPDAVLYAGDDLGRFLRARPTFLLKTRSHSILFDHRRMKPVSNGDASFVTDSLLERLPGISEKLDRFDNDFIEKCRFPIHYVNGNDDPLIEHRGEYYLRVIGERFWLDGSRVRLTEDKSGRMTFRDIPDDFSDEEDDPLQGAGVFVPARPSFGRFTIRRRNKSISVFGSPCTYGLESDLVRLPDAHSDILLSHVPPYGVLDLSVRFGVAHIGSKRLRRAIEKHQPRMVICGHSHFWGGTAARLGRTTVLNLASDDRPGSPGMYAVLNTSDWSYRLGSLVDPVPYQIRGMRTVDRSVKELFVTSGSITALKARTAYVKAFGSTTSSLATKLNALRRLDRLGIATRTLRKRLMSTKSRRPEIVKRLSFDPETCSFVDVETGLAAGNIPGRLWLVGLWHRGQIHQFTLPSQRKDLLRFLRDNAIKKLASWTTYDHLSLRPLLERARVPLTFIDACQRAANCVVWHTYRLHDFHRALFPSTVPEADLIPGRIAGIYADHLILPKVSCRHCPPRVEVAQTILERNKVDLEKMVAVCRKLAADEGDESQLGNQPT